PRSSISSSRLFCGFDRRSGVARHHTRMCVSNKTELIRQPFSHASASLNFTMSPLILTIPFQLPRNDFAVAETGETLAIGRPRLVMIKVLPFATSSSNARHLALNSLAPKVDSFMALLWIGHNDQSTGHLQ